MNLKEKSESKLIDRRCHNTAAIGHTYPVRRTLPERKQTHPSRYAVAAGSRHPPTKPSHHRTQTNTRQVLKGGSVVVAGWWRH